MILSCILFQADVVEMIVLVVAEAGGEERNGKRARVSTEG